MNNRFEEFKKLHEQNEPLLIGNVWNAQSARLFEKLKFKAVATSSAAVAETLGYADGEQMPFDDYCFVAQRIVQSVSIPVSIDLEGGYARTATDIAANIRRLSELGIAGINLEDTRIENSTRTIADATTFSQLLKEVMAQLKLSNTYMFVNVRCDAFLLGLPEARKEAIQRAHSYQQAGVHGLFFPCITDLEDIRAVTGATSLPVNVMCMPDLPRFSELQAAGVKRISMGNFLNQNGYALIANKAQTVLTEGSFNSLFA